MDLDYNGILNAGTGIACSFNQVVEMLNENLGSTAKSKYMENPIKNYVKYTLADVSKAKNTLGFRSQISLEKGIGILVEYYLGS